MPSIMPHGWERKAMRKRLEEELRQARAAELAAADAKQRARIEKEIQIEIAKRLGKRGPFDFLDPGLWHH
jgi:hypothetical protein